MNTGLLALAALGVSGSFVKEPCGLDYPTRGMSRIPDPVCATDSCKQTANCTWGCLGEDNPECAWCVYDSKLCEKNFDPSTDNNMCAKFTYGMQKRQPGIKGCPGFDDGLPFVKLDHHCLKRGNDVPNLPNDFMTVAQAQKRCGMNRGTDGSSNCKGFWYYKEANSAYSSGEPLSVVGPPKLQCDVDLPAYGMYLLPDPTCKNATGDALIGCIGTDDIPCSRCVYDLAFCKSVFDKDSPGMCDQFVKSAQERHAPSCVPRPHSGETYIWFKQTWEPVLKSSGECEDPKTLQQLLGVSLDFDTSADPEAQFDPLEIQVGTTVFTGTPYMTSNSTVLLAWKQCWNDQSKCVGFAYGAPDDDPPEELGVEFRFFNASAGRAQLPSATMSTYLAEWSPPSVAKIVVV